MAIFDFLKRAGKKDKKTTVKKIKRKTPEELKQEAIGRINAFRNQPLDYREKNIDSLYVRLYEAHVAGVKYEDIKAPLEDIAKENDVAFSTMIKKSEDYLRNWYSGIYTILKKPSEKDYKEPGKRE